MPIYLVRMIYSKLTQVIQEKILVIIDRSSLQGMMNYLQSENTSSTLLGCSSWSTKLSASLVVGVGIWVALKQAPTDLTKSASNRSESPLTPSSAQASTKQQWAHRLACQTLTWERKIEGSYLGWSLPMTMARNRTSTCRTRVPSKSTRSEQATCLTNQRLQLKVSWLCDTRCIMRTHELLRHQTTSNSLGSWTQITYLRKKTMIQITITSSTTREAEDSIKTELF